MSEQTAQPSFGAIWWLHPGKLILRFILPIYLFVALVVPTLWPELILLRTRVYMDTEYVLLGAAAIAVMGVAASLGGRLRLRRHGDRCVYEVNERFLWAIGTIAIVAYLIWFAPVLATGQLLEKEELNQTPGITSFTQLGVPYVVCYLYAIQRAGQPLSTLSRLLFRLLILFTLARVYLSAERLALIEIAVPAAVLTLTYHRPRRRATRTLFHLVSRYGPVLGIPLLFLFFGVTEFFRSWASYSTKQDVSLVDFIISRVTTYYYTALNNGAGMLATSSWPDYDLVFVLEWIYRLPFGIGAFFWSTLGRHEMPHGEFLDRFGDPEFNNMSGIYPVFFDLGVVGGVLYFALLGLLMGIAHHQATRERPLGTLVFPSMIVGCIELLRILYLNNTRCFVILVGAAIASTQLRPRRPVAPRAVVPPTLRAAQGRRA